MLEGELKVIQQAKKDGSEWEICVVEEGVSRNNTYFTPEVLKDAIPLFEGAPVYLYEFRPEFYDHLPTSAKELAGGGLVKNLVGWLENVRYGKNPKSGKKGLLAKFRILDSAKWLKEKFKELWRERKTDLLGFSIDAKGELEKREICGKIVDWVKRISSRPRPSVDVVSFPAAGGGLIRLVASLTDKEREGKMEEEILELLKKERPEWLEGFEDPTTEDLVEIFEANLERAKGVFEDLKDSKDFERISEVARGVNTLQTILSLLAAKKFAEAAQLIKNWIAVYPRPEKEAPPLGFYSFPYGAPQKGYPGPGQLRPYYGQKEAKTSEKSGKRDEMTSETAMSILLNLIESEEYEKAKELTEEWLKGFEGLEPLEEAARGAETLKTILQLLAAKKFDEAARLIKNWLAVYPKPGKYPRPPYGFYSAPYGAPYFGYPGPEKLRPYYGYGVKSAEDKMKEAEEALEKIKLKERNLYLKDQLSESNLPERTKDKIRKRFENKIFSDEELKQSIEEETEYLAALTESGEVKGFGSDQARIEWGQDPKEKLQKAFDLMMGYEPDETEKKDYEGITPFRGIREAYEFYTGDKDITGRFNPSGLLSDLRQSLTTGDFAYALGTSYTRRLVKLYREIPAEWQDFVNIVNVRDFKLQELIRWGGFPDLSTVAEDAEYAELTPEPTDERATYSVETRGNRIIVTRKAIINDDLRLLRQIPDRVARAARRTESKFVYDLVLNWDGVSINGGTIYDGTALYTTAHGNLLEDALSYDTLNAAIDTMMNFKEANSEEPLGIRPAFLIVPVELRALATTLLQSEVRPEANRGHEINILRGAMRLIVSPYLRGDTNNWYCIASPRDIQGLEIGYLNGRREPEILVQDVATAESVFLYDRITYKVRHEYGGCVVDWRAFVGSLVP